MHSKPRNSNFASRLARRPSTAAIACAAAFLAAALSAQAQSAADYPHKPVRIFVPYGPGGVGDLTMRLLADKLSNEVKQQFVIENRPGAGGIVAMKGVLRFSRRRLHAW